MARKINTDHLVLETPPHYPHHIMRCKHCGAAKVVELPISLDAYPKLLKAFLRQHRRCLPPTGPIKGEPS